MCIEPIFKGSSFGKKEGIKFLKGTGALLSRMFLEASQSTRKQIVFGVIFGCKRESGK
jgi:hypothetical protein